MVFQKTPYRNMKTAVCPKNPAKRAKRLKKKEATKPPRILVGKKIIKMMMIGNGRSIIWVKFRERFAKGKWH